MELEYREKIIMHALYPKKQATFNLNAMKSLLFYACLFELTEKNILSIESKKLWCGDNQTGDPVLDVAISLIAPFSGKNISRMKWLSLIKQGEIYKKQMELMTENHLLSQEDIIFISWKVGNRYRVRKYDLLKPGVAKLERALVYGRDPDRQTMIMTVLAGEGNLFNNIFTIREFRKKAKQRYRELLQSDLFTQDRIISLLYKSLRKTLTAQKAAASYSV